MENQVFIFGSFSECEASHFQRTLESPQRDNQTGVLSPCSSPRLVKRSSGSDDEGRSSRAVPVAANGNGNLKDEGRFDLDASSICSVSSDEARLVSSNNGRAIVPRKESEDVHIGNGVAQDKDQAKSVEPASVVNGLENISLHYKDAHADSDARTPHETLSHLSHRGVHLNGDISISSAKDVAKTWASLLDKHENGSPRSRDSMMTENADSKCVKAIQTTELSGDSWIRSLKEVEVTGKRLQPRGLINKGNLCFLNATLQALLSCSPFVHLLHTLHVRGLPEVGFPTLHACVELFKEFEFQEHNDRRAKISINIGRPFVPSMFDNILHQFNPHQPSTGAARSRQEDAQESLSFIINHLHDELLRLEAKEPAPPSRSSTTSAATEEDDWETVGPKNRTAFVRTHSFCKSALSDIFGGELFSVVKTKGSKASATVQPFLVLHLDILPEAVYTVEDALKLFAAPETLEGYKSTVGKAGVVSASKSVKLQSLPRVLILHVKRFSYGAQGSSKLHKPLHFPVNLTLGRDLLATTVGTGSELRSYELVATVTHHGKDPTRGHYTAHSKQSDGQWLRFDDGVVSTVSVSRVLQDSVYLLFYKRCVHTQ